MTDHSRYYITAAFLLGVALTAAYQNWSIEHASEQSEGRLKQQQRLISKFSKITDLDNIKKSLAEIEQSLEKGGGNIKEGIEGCIGDTPLIKIKSLSEATGCDILAKAEVIEGCKDERTTGMLTFNVQFLNGAGNSPKDRVALSIIQMVRLSYTCSLKLCTECTQAEEKGLLIPHSGDTIYEGTVGSTGISLAAICRARGYKAHM